MTDETATFSNTNTPRGGSTEYRVNIYELGGGPP